MTTSARQDRQFAEHMSDDKWLENAIDWISSNMVPEDVFSDKQLANWAADNGWSKE